MPFIEQRLESLNKIDNQVVQLLDKMSSIFETYTSKKSDSNTTELQNKITVQTKDIYGLISKIAIGLRDEVKIMDENTGQFDKNDDKVMIFPIAVDQKNSTLGEAKLNHELEQLSQLIDITKPSTQESTNKDEKPQVDQKEISENPIQQQTSQSIIEKPQSENDKEINNVTLDSAPITNESQEKANNNNNNNNSNIPSDNQNEHVKIENENNNVEEDKNSHLKSELTDKNEIEMDENSQLIGFPSDDDMLDDDGLF